MEFVTNPTQLIQPSGSLIPEPLTEKDKMFSAIDPKNYKVVLQEDGQWIQFLPEKVSIQKLLDGDSMGCAGFSDNTVDSGILKKRYGIDVDFSEIYTVVGSKTNPKVGNSMKAAPDFKIKYGFLYENELPYKNSMTINQFYSDIPQTLYKLGQSRLNIYDTGYLMVNGTDQKTLLDWKKISPIKIGVEGHYVMDSNGLIKNTGYKNNHAVVLAGHKFDRLGNLMEFHVRCSETNQLLRFRPDYKFQTPVVKYLEKKNPLWLVKVEGIPAVYIYSMQTDKYYFISDSKPQITPAGESIVITGGMILKAFCGNNYKNANIQIIKPEDFDSTKIAGSYEMLLYENR